MRKKLVLAITALLLSTFLLGFTIPTHSKNEKLPLKGYDEILPWYPHLKEMNAQGKIKPINKEIIITKNTTLTIDAVFMDKYNTLLLYTLTNKDKTNDSYMNEIANISITNLKGIESDKYSGTMTTIGKPYNDNIYKGSILFWGRPDSSTNTIKLSISTMSNGCKNIDLDVDKENILNAYLEKTLTTEVKEKNGKVKLCKIYASPLRTLIFAECHNCDAPSWFTTYSYGESYKHPSGIYVDNKKIECYEECYKGENKIKSYYLSSSPLPVNAQKIILNHNNSQLPIVNLTKKK